MRVHSTSRGTIDVISSPIASSNGSPQVTLGSDGGPRVDCWGARQGTVLRLKPRNGVRFVTDDSDPCSCEFAAVSQLAKLRHLRILGEYAYIFILNPDMACVSEYGRADAIVKVV